ncbi:hypothetical protein WN943_016070 [Citrus x changshan-huyou]
MASLNKFHIPKERYFNNGFEQKETEVKTLDLNNKNELKYRGFMRKYSFKRLSRVYYQTSNVVQSCKIRDSFFSVRVKPDESTCPRGPSDPAAITTGSQMHRFVLARNI